uniref:NADH-ubiquinone oxidoreductase chain 4L n=1 Tax=Neuroctenus parus TaxID=498951 RepID=B7SMH5_9HEMI|nr:NADH dehydrogenase subunit 4L [Neuroctenus parus]ABZ02069.1 NADH dehydrogenase subunit 4L [Neuroctenus parus]
MKLLKLIINIVMMLGAMVAFVSNKRHVLLALLSLEYAVLLHMYGFSCLSSIDGSLSYLLLIYMTFAVGESVLGLSVLTFMVRSYGNDYVSSIFPLW